jgi:short-subunit dehydrogenase
VLCLDLTEPEAPRRLLDWSRQANFDVDILVNCAGIFSNVDEEMGGVRPGDRDLSVDDGDPCLERKDAEGRITGLGRVEALLRLHVLSLTQLCLIFGRLMIRRGGGYILNVASISALFPDPSSLTYGPSKRYVLSFSRLLHLHWREHDVRVTCLVPGAVNTNFFSSNNIVLPTMVRSRLMSADRCAGIALRALFRGRCVVRPGIWSRLHTWLFRLLLRPTFYTPLKNIYLSMRERDQ